MTNRAAWKFSYPASKVLEGAKAKITFHEGRLKFWTETRAKAKAAIEKEGITVDESQTDMLSNSSYGRGANVLIDTKMGNDLIEAVQRQRHHRETLEDYKAWEQVLSSQGDAALDLAKDDWLYFFGK